MGIFSVLSLFFYLTCATPGYGWRDGPELAVTAAFLDVAHPSGFPTFNLLAKAATWLPLGSLPFRVTLFTALAGAASIFLMGLLLKKLHNLGSGPPKYLYLLSPLIFYTLHQSIFAASIEVEVYSLNAALLLVLLFCASMWHSGRGVVWLYTGGLLYGAACGNHASLALYLPVLLLLTFWTRPPNEELPVWKTHGQRLLILALFFLAGLSVYLFLLIRSQTDRLPVDFSRTNTWARLWMHVSDQKDSEYHFKGLLNFQELFYFLKIQFSRLTSPLFWLSLPFVLWGLKYLWRWYQILSVSLVVLIGINLFFFYYWIDGSSAFVPSLICFFILLGLGLGQFGRFLADHKRLSRIVCPVMAVFMAVSLISLGKDRRLESDAESGFMATELFWPDMANLPPDALAVHNSQWFSAVALAQLYNVRPDVTVIWHSSLFQPAFFSPPVLSKMPGVLFPTQEDGSLLPPDTPNYFSYFIVPNMEAGRPVYLQFGQEVEDLMTYLVPEKPIRWLGRLTQERYSDDLSLENGTYSEYLKWLRQYMASLAVSKDPPLAGKAPAYLMYITSPIARLAAEKKYYEDGAETLKTMLTVFSRPDGSSMFPMDVTLNLHAYLANTYRRAGNFTESLKYAEKLIALSPFNPNSYYILGLIHDTLNQGPETLAAWKKSADLDKFDASFLYHYHLALAKYVSVDEALKFLTERGEFFKSEYMMNLYNLSKKFSDCLLLPPEETGIIEQ
ncbi:MAG: DUF2723 domain-containing protein [Deltaproteobacteria bacterium]|nr:DUF2723 domain-containing protein [Deltaproteobacteria bacterium]